MQPNILFLVVDSFRADRFYGKEKSSFTPTLDKLRDNGVYFCQNISSADGTILSLNSIFNGVFPSVTGTREIKLLLKSPNYLSSLIDEDYSIYTVMPKLTSFSPLLNIGWRQAWHLGHPGKNRAAVVYRVQPASMPDPRKR